MQKFRFKTENIDLMPIKKTKYSAGYDVFCNEEIRMRKGYCYLVGTGLYIEEAPEDFYLELHPRSSLRYKIGCEGIGIIDPDYREEIKFIFYPKKDYILKVGDRIGQLIPKKMYDVMDCLESEDDRFGGFGST
jgi:deoxyuridine 5'-triphosphate nucleotidohydrolase